MQHDRGEHVQMGGHQLLARRGGNQLLGQAYGAEKGVIHEVGVLFRMGRLAQEHFPELFLRDAVNPAQVPVNAIQGNVR